MKEALLWSTGTKYPHLKIAFRGKFVIGSVFIVFSISKCVENKKFHFFVTYGFRLMKEIPGPSTPVLK